MGWKLDIAVVAGLVAAALASASGCAVLNPEFADSAGDSGGQGTASETTGASAASSPNPSSAVTTASASSTNADSHGEADTGVSTTPDETTDASDSGVQTSGGTTDGETSGAEVGTSGMSTGGMGEGTIVLFASDTTEGNFANGELVQVGSAARCEEAMDMHVDLQAFQCNDLVALVVTPDRDFDSIAEAHNWLPDAVTGDFVGADLSLILLDFADIIAGVTPLGFNVGVTAHLGIPEPQTYWWGNEQGGALTCESWTSAAPMGNTRLFNDGEGTPEDSEAPCESSQRLLCACLLAL